MSLERLVEEVRRRSESDLDAERKRFSEEARRLLDQRTKALATIAEESERSTALEATRIRAAENARAKVEGRKLVFEARQRAVERSLDDARRRLGEFADSDDYDALLKRLYDYAVARLGKPVRISGRSADAVRLKSLAGKGFDASPIPTAGGLIAESSDGSRRLDLSFEELLRRREDDLLELARGAGTGG